MCIRDRLKIFEELGCYGQAFRFLPKRKLLLVVSDGMWGALAPRSNIADYEMERSIYIEKVKQGYQFFEISKEDGLVLVDTELMRFDWTKLSDKEFVELCYDILKSFPQMKEVKITEGTGDLGQDIEAIEVLTSLYGEIKLKWTIQCKHFPSRKIASSDISRILNSHSQLKFDVFCLMTSNLLLPSCRRMLEKWNSQDYPFKVVIWDVKKIEDYLRNTPEIYARYFTK